MQKIILFSMLFSTSLFYSQAQISQDNFEGNSTISTWFGDDCGMDINFINPHQTGINTSAKVMKYSDIGGTYANVRFDAGFNFNLASSSVFTLKIYVPSSGITGNLTNQISLKLQNGGLSSSWTTQCEIIKPIVLNQWQTITFNFATDAYINMNPASGNPINRFDFNRVVIQINGENNNSQVVSYIDDFLYSGTAFNSGANSIYNNLVWFDEFDGNGAINSSKWHHQTQLPNGISWYNGEKQHYTNRQINSNQSNGSLNIVAKKETFTDQGQTKLHTSARLNSKFAFKYGRVVVRAKLPTGIGTWPAIWMLGKNITEPGGFWASNFGTTGWPACGEIDIMEHWGSNQNYVQSAMHTPSSFGGTTNLGGQTVANASTQFHIYSLEWSPSSMTFSLDNIVHYFYNPAVKNASTWPFDAEQYLLLNVAIQSNIASDFIQSTMEVDYVRVYQQAPLSVLNENKKSKFLLFPNPTSDKLTLKNSDRNIETKAKIYSVLGQEINSIILNENETIIDVSKYKNGIYLIQVFNESGAETYKFVKQ
jgi:beta-glucanase (GH16 family)